MKCFERLVLAHIRDTININVDPHQYAYRRNRSVSDAVSAVVYSALTHLESRDSYVRLVYLDFSSAFNNIMPQTLVKKLLLLGLDLSLCNWVLDFLTNFSVKIHDVSSSTITLNTGSPQGCVLSPLLYTLLPYDCSARYPSNHIVKFADNMAVVGLISNNDESVYRQEMDKLVDWCRANNLCINVGKTKEMVVDFRRRGPTPLPSSLGEQLWKWCPPTSPTTSRGATSTASIIKKAHQRLYFLRRLKRASLSPAVLTSFYQCVVESMLTSSITVWNGNCSAADERRCN